MPKGKKFNAAERHFLGKEAAYKDEIRALKARLSGKDEAIKALVVTRDHLQAQNRALDEHVDRLLEYMDLNRDDIKAACQKDKQIASVMETFRRMAMLF